MRISRRDAEKDEKHFLILMLALLTAEEAVPPGESLCRPYSREVAALYNGKRLTSADVTNFNYWKGLP